MLRARLCGHREPRLLAAPLAWGVYLQHCNHQQQHWPGVTQKGLNVDKPEQAEGLDACRLDNIPRRAERQAMHMPRSVQKNLGVTLCSALERDIPVLEQDSEDSEHVHRRVVVHKGEC